MRENQHFILPQVFPQYKFAIYIMFWIIKSNISFREQFIFIAPKCTFKRIQKNTYTHVFQTT